MRYLSSKSKQDRGFIFMFLSLTQQTSQTEDTISAATIIYVID